jgi:magnesium chelatase family protein
MIQRYVAKISGPLLDRIDIPIEVPAVQYKELRGGAAAEGSAEIRTRVMQPANLAPTPNACLSAPCSNRGLTAGAHDRILKLARTIADLEGADQLVVSHLGRSLPVPHSGPQLFGLDSSRRNLCDTHHR